MIMFGLKLTKKIPFHIVYIHGLIQDRDGQKMSKSKGNVLDPIDLIDGVNLNDLIAKRTSSLMQPDIKKSIEVNTRKEFSNGISAYGADALRFTFCALATTGRYIRFDLARVEGYRNFCNKIWNAARYVLINTDGHALDLKVGAKDYSIADKWILSRWQHVKAIIIEHFDKYRFDLVAQDIYEFTWNEYCDWYLEYSKVILYGREISDAQIRGTRLTLLQVLEELLCVLHPIMPFITEEIWQKITSSTMRTTCTLIEYTFPTVKTELIDKKVELIIEWTKTFIIGIRNIRGEMNISPNKLLPLIIFNASEKDKSYIHAYFPFLQSLAKIESFTFVKGEEDAPLAATSLVGNTKLFIPISGLIDKKVEIIRLQKEIDKCKKSLLRSEHKLDNPSYVNKAPKDVIEKERNRVSRLKISIDSLEGSLKSVGSI